MATSEKKIDLCLRGNHNRARNKIKDIIIIYKYYYIFLSHER